MKQFGSEGIETPFDMPETPEGWQIALLGQIAQIVGGGTPKTSDSSNFSEGEYPWITPADLSGFNEMYISRGRRSLSEQGLKTSSALLMPKGTVLMSSRAPIGYLAIAANELCTNQGFKSFICSPGVTPEYVFFWLKLITPFLENIGSGSTFLEISGSRARKIPILLAPTSEQKRIITKVEELLARVNTAKERLNKVPKILKRFRQAILAAACSGRLTATWREKNTEVEPSKELLQRIKSDPKRLVRRKRRDAELDENDMLTDIPETWTWATFGDVCVKIFDGSHFSPKNYPQGDFKYITAKNIKEGKLDLSQITYVSKENHDEIYARCDVKKGDVLYIKDGATTGIAAVNPLEEPFSLLSSVGVFRTNDSHLLPAYLSSFLNCKTTRDRMLMNVAGVAITRLTLEKLEVALFCLPPFEEQQEIVRRVESMFKLADGVEKRVGAATVQAEKLTQAILAKAFRGELVPTEAELARRDGRSYEPASDLMARIKSNFGKKNEKNPPESASGGNR